MRGGGRERYVHRQAWSKQDNQTSDSRIVFAVVKLPKKLENMKTTLILVLIFAYCTTALPQQTPLQVRFTFSFFSRLFFEALKEALRRWNHFLIVQKLAYLFPFLVQYLLCNQGVYYDKYHIYSIWSWLKYLINIWNITEMKLWFYDVFSPQWFFNCSSHLLNSKLSKTFIFLKLRRWEP